MTKWQMAVVTEVKKKTPAGRTKTIDVEIKTEDGRKVKRKGYPPQAFAPVSYTHLTLPTTILV